MLTYLIAIVGAFLLSLIFRGKKTFSKPFTTGLWCLIGAVITLSIVNIVRLPTLNTKIVMNAEYSLEDFKINTDTTFILKDTIRTDSSGIENIRVKTEKFETLEEIDEKYRDDVILDIDYYETPLIISESKTIKLQYLDSKGEPKVKILENDVIISKINTDKYTLKRYSDKYIGDKWCSSIGLPDVNQRWVLYIPKNDTIITAEVLNNYKIQDDYEDYIIQYNR